MAVYSVEGKLGTGKTKFCVWMAQQAMLQGRLVASNVDMQAHRMTPYRKRPQVMRVPDKPTADDLDAIGHGNADSYDESKNGVLILDELGTWLNSRSFQDKSRAGLIDWLIHARKKGWDVYLIVQDAGIIDKQVREALIEYQCRCVRMDKVRIPFVGKLLGLFHEKWGYLPRFHIVTARVGYGAGAVVAERWIFRGDDLHDAYDTRQVFVTDYPHGSHSVLPPHDYSPLKTPLQLAVDALRARKVLAPPQTVRPPLKPRHRALQLMQGLPPDERLRLARRYAQSLDIAAASCTQAATPAQRVGGRRAAPA